MECGHEAEHSAFLLDGKRQGEKLVIGYGEANRVMIDNYFLSQNCRIDQLEFKDGTYPPRRVEEFDPLF